MNLILKWFNKKKHFYSNIEFIIFIKLFEEKMIFLKIFANYLFNILMILFILNGIIFIVKNYIEIYKLLYKDKLNLKNNNWRYKNI